MIGLRTCFVRPLAATGLRGGTGACGDVLRAHEVFDDVCLALADSGSRLQSWRDGGGRMERDGCRLGWGPFGAARTIEPSGALVRTLLRQGTSEYLRPGDGRRTVGTG